MQINISEIKDYMRCPLYYKFKHVDGLAYTKTLDDLYSEYLKTSIYYFYFSAIESKVRSIESLLKKWENLWFSSEMRKTFYEEDLRHASTKASMVFTNFYKDIDSEKFSPIAVNFASESMFPGEENAQVIMNTDLIKVANDRTRNSSTEIVFFNTKKTREDDFMLRNDLKLTLASHSFRSSFKTKEDRIVVHNITTRKKTPTVRTGSDFSRAEKIVRNICTGISNNVFYPAPNKLYCTNCRYKLYCMNERSL